jgi:hypothetical protein
MSRLGPSRSEPIMPNINVASNKAVDKFVCKNLVCIAVGSLSASLLAWSPQPAPGPIICNENSAAQLILFSQSAQHQRSHGSEVNPLIAKFGLSPHVVVDET